MKPVAELLDGLLESFLPTTCAACEEWQPLNRDGLCAACARQVADALAASYCRRCGRGRRPESIFPDGCSGCRTEDHWNLARTARLGGYAVEPLRQLALDLKYRGRERNARILGRLLAAHLRDEAWCAEIACLVPVPMHPLRRWQRPCEHARLLAIEVGRWLRTPVRQAVRRLRYAPSQTTCDSRHERIENVKDCFAAAPGSNVNGCIVCIIDNVVTSGATLHEVSKTLRRAGAKRICAAYVARAILPGDFQAELSG